MSDFEKLFNNPVIPQEKYDDLIEYLEESLYEAGLDVTYVESEGTMSTRFDFNNETSIWVNGPTVEGHLFKSAEKKVTKIIKNSPTLLTSYMRFS